MANSLYQQRLMLFWGIDNPLNYVARLKVTLFQHYAYFQKFQTIGDMERALWNLLVKNRYYDFNKHCYVAIQKGVLPWKN